VNLSDVGESRINGYLFVLQRSLKTFLPAETVRDAVREIESHLRERIASVDGAPNEREAVEKILGELGPPLRVAQAYSAERTLDEAITTGRLIPMFHAMWHLAVTTIGGFFAALAVLVGYLFGLAFLSVAVMKPLFPQNVGLWVDNDTGIPHELGGLFPPPANQHVVGGYWIIPICLVIGLTVMVLTYRGTKRFLTWWRNRRVS
jgi:amino acid transporter